MVVAGKKVLVFGSGISGIGAVKLLEENGADVVLYDEPCSALDPISTYTIEETIRSLCDTGLCQIIVTHNMEQAGRVSDRTAFFYVGDMVETGTTQQIFSAPKDQRLADYLTGRFG